MNAHENAMAVKELLLETEPEVCVAHLDDMWESWLTNESNDYCTANVRADVLATYKSIRNLLLGIKKSPL
jgi:hypothetical protein